MNVRMVKELCSSYAVLFNTFSMMLFTVGYTMRYYDNPTVLFTLFVGFLPSAMSLSFFDALPTKLRTRVTATAIVFGILWCVVFGTGLYFNLFQEENWRFYVGRIDFSAESLMANALINLICLFSKFLKSALSVSDDMSVS